MFYGGVDAVKSLISGNSVTISKLALKIVAGRTAPHLYYIIVLIQLTIIAPLLLKVIRGKGKWILYLITPVWLICIYIWCYTMGEVPPLYHTFFPAWIGFYVWGMECRNKKYECFRWIWLIPVAVLMEVAEAYISLKLGAPVAFSCTQLRFSSFLLACSVIRVFLGMTDKSCSERRIAKRLEYIGDKSYGIYFIHYIFILSVRSILNHIQVEVAGITWFIPAVISFIVALSGSLAVMKIGRLILDNCGLSKLADVIGF